MRKSGLLARWEKLFDAMGFRSHKTAADSDGQGPLAVDRAAGGAAVIDRALLGPEPDRRHCLGRNRQLDGRQPLVERIERRVVDKRQRAADFQVTGNGTAGTVTLDSAASAATVTFAMPGYTLGGNALTLTGTGTTIIANQSATINSAMTLGASQTWSVASGTALTVAGKKG